jgi:hypothetical protein
MDIDWPRLLGIGVVLSLVHYFRSLPTPEYKPKELPSKPPRVKREKDYTRIMSALKNLFNFTIWYALPGLVIFIYIYVMQSVGYPEDISPVKIFFGLAAYYFLLSAKAIHKKFLAD